MNELSRSKRLPVRELELALLRFASTGPKNLSAGQGREEWIQYFGTVDDEHGGAATWLLRDLMDNGYVLPVVADDGKRMGAWSGHDGISPKGVDRLYQLEYPVRHWLRQQSVAVWGAAAATIAAVSSLALLVARFIN